MLARALAKDPGERFESGAELGAAAIAAAGAGARIASMSPAARRRDRGRRPGVRGRAEAVAAFEHAVTRAALHEQALTETPAERIERRLAEVRAGSDPGKAKLVAALASQLAVQRRMQAVLDAYNADIERMLVELETVRGRAGRRGEVAKPRRAAGRDRDARGAARRRRWGIRHLG